MEALKLAAFDTDDLVVVSAHCQDALAKPVEASFDKRTRTFVLPIRRYAWEKKRRFFGRGERRLAALSIGAVSAVRSSNIDQAADEAVLNLLAIRFTPSEAEDDPGGTVELVFSADATIALDVECIELRLADLGAAWQTENRPAHKL
ncbi:hypothetical protein B7H23_01220 [Notoacmeibacter marinus]|uniref:DUF2948 domain-containing protein n=1 Tax=Notoacmeibacter marinus TaxID=1876515 RepID=A0A231V0C2_9HYPH|nr:DUF2948 family protein [Notoacmeibacter marinus]OXT01622.1 hypothetical protein B7H23_01220 [Notoacmeibacter marinus]